MMNTKRIASTLFTIAMALVLAPRCAWAQDKPFRITSLAAKEGFDQARLQALAEALDFATWPRPEARFVAPAISRALLARPDLLTGASHACTTVGYDDGLWGRCDWNWRQVQRSREMDRSQVLGNISVEVALGPSARAAQEYLLTSLAGNMLPIEALVAAYGAAEKPAGLGDVAYHLIFRDGTDQRLHFVRNNVYVGVRAEGAFATQTLSVARAVDARVVSQQPLSYEQLVARRPTVSLERPRAGAIGYRLSPRVGQRVITTLARINGQQIAVGRGRVPLPDREAELDVEVITITGELLVGTSSIRLP
jgi:hypothetical protein